MLITNFFRNAAKTLQPELLQIAHIWLYIRIFLIEAEKPWSVDL